MDTEEKKFWLSFLNIPHSIVPQTLTELFLTFVYVDEDLIEDITALILAIPKLFPNIKGIYVYYKDVEGITGRFVEQCKSAMKQVSDSKDDTSGYLFPILFEPVKGYNLIVSYSVDTSYYSAKKGKQSEDNSVEGSPIDRRNPQSDTHTISKAISRKRKFTANPHKTYYFRFPKTLLLPRIAKRHREICNTYKQGNTKAK